MLSQQNHRHPVEHSLPHPTFPKFLTADPPLVQNLPMEIDAWPTLLCRASRWWKQSSNPKKSFPATLYPQHTKQVKYKTGCKIEKLNLTLSSVLPPLTPKTPVIGPLPKPAAFTGYSSSSQLEAKGLLNLGHESKTDFDDPFEPEAEVRPFLKLNSTLFSGGFPSLGRSSPPATPLPNPLSLPRDLPS